MENPDVNTNDVLRSRSRVDESGVRETEKGRGIEAVIGWQRRGDSGSDKHQGGGGMNDEGKKMNRTWGWSG